MSDLDFDSMDSFEQTANKRPIWMMDLDDPRQEKAVLDWLNAELKFLQRENEDRVREIKHNLARYKGVQYQTLDTRSGNRDREQERAKFSPKMVVNLLSNTTEQRVSRLIKFKPVVQILPQHDEIQDKTSAKIAKSFLDYVQQQQKYETKNMSALRVAAICGEGYLDIVWNPFAGKVHPDFKEGKKQPLLDETGAPVKDADGNDVMIDQEVKVGETEYKVMLPLYLFFEKKQAYEDSNYCFYIERKPTSELQKRYPKMASQIKAETAKTAYNVSKLEEEKLVNETFVITFQHKNNEYMPKGRTIVFTKDCILENGKNRYDHGDFSFERMVDIEIPGEQHAVSFFTLVKGMQAQYNNLTNAIIRNQMLTAHPKWFVPRGTVKVESLGNDITVVQYQGGVPPTLGQQNPTPSEVFNFRTTLRDEIMMLSQVGDVLRGEPPAGITSGVALTFVAEQERQIANAQIVNYNEFVRRVAMKTLQVCAQFYDKSDKRTMLILGKNAAWVASEFDPEVLARPYDIRIQNSSALPDSKAARMQSILDFAQTFPGMFPQEQVVEMLDLGQADKYLTDGAAAARSAEAENEQILDGKPVDEPAEYESSLVHWTIHFKAMQDSSFKKMPPERQQAMKDHLLATEFLIFEQGNKNPILLQQASANPFFPVFYVPPVPPAPMPPPDMLPPEGMGPGPEQAPPMDMMAPPPPGSEVPSMEIPPDEMSAAPGGGFQPL